MYNVFYQTKYAITDPKQFIYLHFYIGLSYFLRMLGPALGYTLASYCLQLYIAPSLTPTINNIDPRWLGAWWLGWIVLGALMTVSALFLGMCNDYNF